LIGKRLKTQREVIKEALKEKKENLIEEKKRLLRAEEKWKIATFREYPFILYTFEEVKNALFHR